MKKVLFALVLFTACLAKAQNVLTLQTAINTALKNNFDIQLAKNNVEINNILNNYGVAGGLPYVAGSASDVEQLSSLNQKFSTGDSSRTVKASNVASNSLNLGVSANMLLYNGMRVVSTKKRLEQIQLQSEQVLNSQLQNTIAEVMTRYYDVVRQQSYSKTLELSIQVSKLRLQILQTRQAAGLANNADIFQAQIDLNQLEQQLETQQLTIDVAKTELLRLMILNPSSKIEIKDTILVDKAILLDSVLTSLTTNPDIIAADQQVKINELVAKETAAQRYPSVSVNAGYTYGRSQNAAGQLLLNQRYGPQAGVTVAIPIYSGSALRRQQKVAETETKNASLQKESLINDYNANAVKTYQAYENTLNQLEKEKKNYALTADLVKLVLQKFELRQATIIDLREAQQSFEESGYRLVNLSYVAKAAEIELKRVSNQLSF